MDYYLEEIIEENEKIQKSNIHNTHYNLLCRELLDYLIHKEKERYELGQGD